MIQFFFACLLALLASWPHFCLVVDLAIGFSIGLAIGGAKSISKEIAFCFLR